MMATQLKHQSVINGEKYDQVLHRVSFPINMRLLGDSREYREVIYQIKRNMIQAFYNKYSDYDDIQGISGPNMGIPLNIIAIRIRKKDNEFMEGLPDAISNNEWTHPILFMLNPDIVAKSTKTYATKSNCGSLLLANPVEVYRYEWIRVFFFDLNGGQYQLKFERPIAATIQHEIDHLNGLLILDKQAKEKTNDT